MQKPEEGTGYREQGTGRSKRLPEIMVKNGSDAEMICRNRCRNEPAEVRKAVCIRLRRRLERLPYCLEPDARFPYCDALWLASAASLRQFDRRVAKQNPGLAYILIGYGRFRPHRCFSKCCAVKRTIECLTHQ